MRFGVANSRPEVSDDALERCDLNGLHADEREHSISTSSTSRPLDHKGHITGIRIVAISQNMRLSGAPTRRKSEKW